MRCPPSPVVSFYAREKELTSVGLACEDGGTGIILGSLTTPVANGPNGGMHVDAGMIYEVQRSLAAP